MTFEIDVEGRTRTISVERIGGRAGRYRVAVDGQPHVVDAVRIGEFGLSLLIAPAEKGTATFSGANGDEKEAVPFSRANGDEKEAVPFSGAVADEKVAVPFSAAEKVAVPAARDVQVTPGMTRGELLVTLDGRSVAVTVNGRRTGRASTQGGTQAAGEHTVVAPMPGRVVRILVSPGDDVVARQGVIVVEAMKMENELVSPRAGRVKDVSVTAGTLVDAGRILVVIE
jgi:biotin carboxyl carrier protein